MHVKICENYDDLSRYAAELIAEIVRQKPAVVLCIASGHTPVGTLQYLARLALDGSLNLHECIFIGLDEWVGVHSSTPGSCCYFLEEYLFNPLKISPQKIHLFDGTAQNLAAECKKMDATLARLGGLDVMLVGIGMNGHIALNEPGTPWHLRSYVSVWEEVTATVGQKYFSEKTALTQGITLGLQFLQEARQPILMASGATKAAVVKRALEGEVSEAFPASIFQRLESGVVLLDEAAAAEMTF